MVKYYVRISKLYYLSYVIRVGWSSVSLKLLGGVSCLSAVWYFGVLAS